MAASQVVTWRDRVTGLKKYRRTPSAIPYCSQEYLVEKLSAGGVPVMPAGGITAVHLDAWHSPPHPGRSIPGSGIDCRTLSGRWHTLGETGSLMFGKYDANGSIPAMLELVRLAIPVGFTHKVTLIMLPK